MPLLSLRYCQSHNNTNRTVNQMFCTHKQTVSQTCCSQNWDNILITVYSENRFSIMKLPTRSRSVSRHRWVHTGTRRKAPSDSDAASVPEDVVCKRVHTWREQPVRVCAEKKKITSHQKIFINTLTYVPTESRLKRFVVFLSLSAFFFERADLPLCLCRRVSREELKHRT